MKQAYRDKGLSDMEANYLAFMQSIPILNSLEFLVVELGCGHALTGSSFSLRPESYGKPLSSYELGRSTVKVAADIAMTIAVVKITSIMKVAPATGVSIDINPVQSYPNAFTARWTQGQAKGGMSFKVNPADKSVSIDGISRGDLMPPLSAGPNAAAALKQHGVPKPKMIEMNHVVEKSTLPALQAGKPAQATTLGDTLQNMADSLGGKITKWETIYDPALKQYHIRVHLGY